MNDEPTPETIEGRKPLRADVEARRAIVDAMVQPAPRCVEFKYVDEGGEESERVVEPYEIKGDQLVGWCKDRDATRRFKLARMQNVTRGEVFRPRFPIKIPC